MLKHNTLYMIMKYVGTRKQVKNQILTEKSGYIKFFINNNNFNK